MTLLLNTTRILTNLPNIFQKDSYKVWNLFHTHYQYETLYSYITVKDLMFLNWYQVFVLKKHETSLNRKGETLFANLLKNLRR